MFFRQLSPTPSKDFKSSPSPASRPPPGNSQSSPSSPSFLFVSQSLLRRRSGFTSNSFQARTPTKKMVLLFRSFTTSNRTTTHLSGATQDGDTSWQGSMQKGATCHIPDVDECNSLLMASFDCARSLEVSLLPSQFNMITSFVLVAGIHVESRMMSCILSTINTSSSMSFAGRRALGHIALLVVVVE